MLDSQEEAVSLRSNCTSAGCGAKIGPQKFGVRLAAPPVKPDPALLAGFGVSHDMAIYALTVDQVLVFIS